MTCRAGSVPTSDSLVSPLPKDIDLSSGYVRLAALMTVTLSISEYGTLGQVQPERKDTVTFSGLGETLSPNSALSITWIPATRCHIPCQE